jgi:DNA-binding MarR family transcriptional regulator
MKSVGEILKNRINTPRTRPLRGFTMILNSFIERTDLSIYEKMVFIVIKKHQMKNSKAWPSQTRIASQARCSITTVKKTVRILRFKGLIEVKRTGAFNSYKLIHSWVATSPTQSRQKSQKGR